MRVSSELFRVRIVENCLLFRFDVHMTVEVEAEKKNGNPTEASPPIGSAALPRQMGRRERRRGGQ